MHCFKTLYYTGIQYALFLDKSERLILGSVKTTSLMLYNAAAHNDLCTDLSANTTEPIPQLDPIPKDSTIITSEGLN